MRKNWEASLYWTMWRVGVRCEKRYRPRWKKITPHPGHPQPFYKYELTNNHERRYFLDGDKKEKDS